MTKLQMDKVFEDNVNNLALTSSDKEGKAARFSQFYSTFDFNTKRSQQLNGKSEHSTGWTTVQIESSSKDDQKSQIFSARV
jgi:hypothetical protein